MIEGMLSVEGSKLVSVVEKRKQESREKAEADAKVEKGEK